MGEEEGFDDVCIWVGGLDYKEWLILYGVCYLYIEFCIGEASDGSVD